MLNRNYVTQPNTLIWDYVKDLLHVHDCVIVPGFGGFVCNREPARIDQVSHVITPPARKVVFNQNLKTNDGLLAEFWSQKQRVSYSQAVAVIEECIESIQHTLHEKKQLSIDLFGSFRLNAEANYVFLPDKRNNYLTSSFGLTPIQAQPVASRVMKMMPKTKTATRPVGSSSQKKKTRSILKPVLAVVMVALLSINGYIFLNDQRISDIRFGENSNALSIGSWFDSLFNDTTPKQEIAVASPVTKETTEPFIPPSPDAAETDSALTAQPPVEQLITEDVNVDLYEAYETFGLNYANARPYFYFPHPLEETIAASDLIIEPVETATVPESEVINSAQAETGFFVIGGMFCKERNARRFLKRLKETGFDEAQLLPSRSENCQRVSYKKFATKREAEHYCVKIKAENNPEAWVLEVF